MTIAPTVPSNRERIIRDICYSCRIYCNQIVTRSITGTQEGMVCAECGNVVVVDINVLELQEPLTSY